jgi:hypothetical protein
MSFKNHKQRCLEQAPAEVLMLRQLAAATLTIVAWIARDGIIIVLLHPLPERITNGSVRF